MTNIFDYHNNFEKYRHVKSLLQYGDYSKCVNPLFSVVMPVYGNPKFFIHSFNSVINQDANFEYEVIVVDNTPIDGDKSDVLELIEKTNFTNVFYYRNEENIGMTGNWNRGVELARSELITFCHDDDMLYPNCLSRLWELHLRYPDRFIIPLNRSIDETICYPIENIEPHKLTGKECISFGKLDIFMCNPTNGVGCLYYKKHLIEFGGYNEEYYPSADNALHIKYVFEKGAVLCRQILFCYRITTNNTSNKVYKQFITNGLLYCDFMSNRMNLPNLVKKILSHAYLTNSTILAEKLWEKKDKYSITPSITDRIVFKFLSCRSTMKVFLF